jgi:hypothetical protein
LLVHRYRLLVPVAQIIRDSAQAIRHVVVATEADIFTLRNALIRHVGGVTVLHQAAPLGEENTASGRAGSSFGFQVERP